jgi:hypothetical protein
VRTPGTPPSHARWLGGGRGAARLTANFPRIEDEKANFFGAHGNVVSGAISLAAGEGPETVLELPGASIVVTAAVDRDNSTELTVHNGTAVPLQAASDVDGTGGTITLAADAATTIPLAGAGSGVHRLHLQIFPSRPRFPDVVTLLVSAQHGSIAGQAFVSAIG